MKTKQMFKTWALMAVLSPLALACLSPDALAQETQNLLGPVKSFEDYGVEEEASELNLNPVAIKINGIIEEIKQEQDEPVEAVEDTKKEGEEIEVAEVAEVVEDNKEEGEEVEVAEVVEVVEDNKEEGEEVEVVEDNKEEGEEVEVVEDNKEEGEEIEVVEDNKEEGEEVEVAEDNIEEDEEVEVVEDNKEEGEEIEVVESDIEENEEENNQQVISLIEKNKGLETTVCEQSSQIANLEEEIKSLQQSATGYMPLMDTMNQLMMMNMMMSQQQNQISYAPSSIDMMSDMLAPMMMMQSMQMGMNIASMNDLYHRSLAPVAPAAPQYHYNVGGDFYGRDYSMQAPQAPQAPTAQTFPTYFEPQRYDFGARNANFDNIQEAPASEGTQRSPGQTQAPQELEQALAADQEMVD